MKTIKRLATLALAVFTSVGVWADVPFTPTTLTDSGEFAENTTWYTMTIGAGKLRISDNNGANKITVGGYLNAADENLWCFVGNETDGFMILNKQAGATKALTAPTAITGSNDGTSYAILADIATLNASTHTNLWNFLCILRPFDQYFQPVYAFHGYAGILLYKFAARNNIVPLAVYFGIAAWP